MKTPQQVPGNPLHDQIPEASQQVPEGNPLRGDIPLHDQIPEGSPQRKKKKKEQPFA